MPRHDFEGWVECGEDEWEDVHNGLYVQLEGHDSFLTSAPHGAPDEFVASMGGAEARLPAAADAPSAELLEGGPDWVARTVALVLLAVALACWVTLVRIHEELQEPREVRIACAEGTRCEVAQ